MDILIAEDERDIVFSYKQALEERNHNVTITNNGDDCLKAYQEKLQTAARENDKGTSMPSSSKLPFDVVILDYKMPKKNGMDVAKEIFSLQPNQRIIFASAYVKSTLEDSLKNLEQVIEVLQKPFNVSALVDTIEDKEITDGLKMFMSNIRDIRRDEKQGNLNPTDEQLRGLLEGLRKIQKGRTF